VQNGGISADATTLTFGILHFMQEIFQEAGCAKQIVIHFAVTNHIKFIGWRVKLASNSSAVHCRFIRVLLKKYVSQAHSWIVAGLFEVTKMTDAYHLYQAVALPRFGMVSIQVSSPGASRHRRRGVLNSYPSSQPLGRLAEISLKWLLLRPYDKGEEARYTTIARAGTHIGHLQWRVRENIGALTLVQDHGRLSSGS
jgi:hypothetical protein